MRALVLIFRKGLGDFVCDVHGAVDVLDVLELLEAVDEALDLLVVVNRDVRGGGGHHRELRALDLDALGLERLLDVLHLVVRGVDDPLVAGVLVGGNGTKFSSTKTGASMAVIDRAGQAGYLTAG